MNSDFWDSRYGAAADADGSVWSLEPNAWVEQVATGLTPRRAVDLAAGEGRNALWLASLGWQVTAVDFSAVGLARGAARAEKLGLTVEWVTADATRWVSGVHVDLVVIAYLQVPADQLARAIHRAAGYLLPGGTLALINHDRDNIERGIGGPRDPRVLTTVDELLAAAATLEIVECRQLERETAEGTAIDAILLARKP